MSFKASQTTDSNRPLRRLLVRPSDEPPPSTLQTYDTGITSRVPRACSACQAHKVKCNGGQPRCRNCLVKHRQCIYKPSRRNHLKTVIEYNQEMIVLLKELSDNATGEKKQQIDDLIRRAVDDVPEAASSLRKQDSPGLQGRDGEDKVSADVGSSEELDIVDEDLLRDKDSRAAGFVGKSSELQWLRRLRQDVEHHGTVPSRGSGPYGPPGSSTEASSSRLETLRQRQHSDPNTHVPLSSSTFYLDDQGVEVDYTVHPFELPPMNVAQNLIRGYMDTVQDSFPILSRSSFMETFRELYASVEHGVSHSVPDKWLAVLNLVFAIGAQYSNLVEESWHIHGFGHLTYLSRAHILGLNTSDLISPPDLMQVQITALLALYFLTTGSANRAWVVIGISVRYAHALGLHVRNEDQSTTVSQKENLVRIWWGLYTLEGTLSTVVGRPSSTIEDYCSAPLPLPVAIERMPDDTLISQIYAQYQGCTIHQSPTVATSEPSNAGSYLKSRARVGAITQQVLTGLYSARAIEMSWKQMQQKISSLRESLEIWLASLPSGLDFTQPTIDSTFQRERLALNMQYIETKILITRPCLCRLDDRIKNQTEASDRFNKDTAKICVSAAEAMADLLPASIDVKYLYRIGPWWSLVHNLMQALTVLLLEASFGMVYFSCRADEILSRIKRLIRWLSAMKTNNAMADRGHALASGILRKLAPRINANVSDLLGEDINHSGDPAANNNEVQKPTGRYRREHLFSTDINLQLGAPGNQPTAFGDPQADYMSMFTYPVASNFSEEILPGCVSRTETVHPNAIQDSPRLSDSIMAQYDELSPIFLAEDIVRTSPS